MLVSIKTLKLLGRLEGRVVTPLAAKMTAHCNRVAVEDGHTESVSIKLGRKGTREDLIAAWAEFLPLKGRDLPTAPAQPVEYVAAEDRPQPRLDRMRGAGMSATVGRVRQGSGEFWPGGAMQALNRGTEAGPGLPGKSEMPLTRSSSSPRCRARRARGW